MVGVLLTVRLTACVAVQPLTLDMVIVPEYVPTAVPAGTTIVFKVPPPAANAYAVLPWLVETRPCYTITIRGIGCCCINHIGILGSCIVTHRTYSSAASNGR